MLIWTEAVREHCGSPHISVWTRSKHLLNLISEVLFLPAGKDLYESHNVQTFSHLSPFSVFNFYTYGSVVPLIVFLLCFLSLLHWRSPCGQFFICAEINFGRLPLTPSLSLSLCLEEEDNKSDNVTFPFVCGGKEDCSKEVRIKNFICAEVRRWHVFIVEASPVTSEEERADCFVNWVWCQDAD